MSDAAEGAAAAVEQPTVPVEGAAEPDVGQQPEQQPEQQQQQQAGPPEPPKPRGLWFVRVPRPHIDDSAIKALEGQLSGCITKLKALNSKAQVKRGEANELRKQLTVARSLRNGSSPEFDEKMGRLKQLREMRKGFLDQIQSLKASRAGLECRTEAELDERIAEMEHSIQHDGLSLNTEKDMVRKISKLKSQREKIREVQGAQEGMAQLEVEAKKLKAVIDEVDSELNILRGERDQAKDIIDELSKKLAVVAAALGDFDSERQDIESSKRELQEQLKALRDDNDSLMFEWRANRKLSLQLRDLVADGRADEAVQTAEEQVSTYLAKLKADPAYRREYLKLWSEQRRYIVSELLPDSGNPGEAAKQPPGRPGAARGRPDKPAAPLVPQGAAKAQAIIAAALADADAEVKAKRAAEPQPQPASDEASEEAGEEREAESAAPEPPARHVVPGASEDMLAPVKHRPRASAAHKAVTELPAIPDYEYVLPPAAKQPAEALSAAEIKARVREEQRQKAAEAEARKKRQQEQRAKKAAAAKQRAAAEQQQQAAGGRAAAAAPAAAAGSSRAQAAHSEAEASGTDGEGEPGPAEAVEQAGAAAAPAQQPSQQRAQQRGGRGGAKQQGRQQQAAKAARGKKSAPKAAARWWEAYRVHLALGSVVLLIALILLMAVLTPSGPAAVRA